MQIPEAALPRRTRLVVAVVLVAMGFTFLAPTRLDIAILLRNIMQGIGVTSLAAGGLISTATLIGDGITEPFLGRLSDRWSRRLSLSLGIALFSFFTLLTALATNFTSMLIVRVLLGIGQAMFIPAHFAFLGGAFGRHRGLVLGSLAGLFTVGAAINPLLTKALFDAGHTWQTPFWYYGVFGLLLAAAVEWLVEEASTNSIASLPAVFPRSAWADFPRACFSSSSPWSFGASPNTAI